MWLPNIPNDASNTPSMSTGNINITATTVELAYVFQIPEDGSLNGLTIRTGGITTGATVGIRFETLASTGYPSGTLIDSNAYGSLTLADTDDNTMFAVNLNSTVTVSRGDEIACRFTVASGSPALNLAAFQDSGLLSVPSIIRSTDSGSSWSLIGGYAPIFCLRYDTSTYPFMDGFFPFHTVSNSAFHSGTSPNTVGNQFTLDTDYSVSGYWLYQDLDGAFTIKIYDGSGVVSSTTYTGTGNLPVTTNGTVGPVLLPASVQLAAGTYVMAIEKTDTTSSSFYYGETDAAYAAAMPGGGDFYFGEASSPSTSSSFTTTASKFLFAGLLIDGFSVDVTEGGGGTTINPVATHVGRGPFATLGA